MLVTTNYLEMTDPEQLRAARAPDVPVQIIHAEQASPEFSRFLYTAVGGDWHWTDRLPWNRQQWTDWLARPGLETWVSWLRGTPTGYIELSPTTEESGTAVEIAYFGLLPGFMGLGIGGHLLEIGIRHAWTLAERWPDIATVQRVWVHTCDLDGPHAMANYTGRGMRIYRTEQQDEPVADLPPGPWPGAYSVPDQQNALEGQP